MDGLSDNLNACKTGCVVGSILVNHLMYADDLVIVSPSSTGLQSLLQICSNYGVDNDVKYNAKKSHVMIIRCKDHRRLIFPDFYLCGAKLDICKEVKKVDFREGVFSNKKFRK